MTTTTQTIADFLLARVSEDEAAARAVVWSDADSYSVYSYLRQSDATHVARHDPARVLAECEAKRVVVQMATSTLTLVRLIGDNDLGVRCASGAEQTLRALAQPYADHPDFDPSWR